MELVKVEFKSNSLEVEPQSQSIVVKDICENIGLSSKSQISKLKSDPTYQSKLIKVQTNGGMQEVFTIPLSKLNGWLFSINPNKVKPEVKAKLIEYKNECFDVLYKHFNKTTQPQQPTHHQIIGYKSQLSQHRKKIAQLEAKIMQLQDHDVIASTVVRALQTADKYKKLQHQVKELAPLLN